MVEVEMVSTESEKKNRLPSGMAKKLIAQEIRCFLPKHHQSELVLIVSKI